MKFAAKRNGQTFGDFVVDVTRTAALAIVRHKPDTPDDNAAEPEVSSTLPVRIEDVAASLTEQIARLSAEQEERLARLSGKLALADGGGSVADSVAG